MWFIPESVTPRRDFLLRDTDIMAPKLEGRPISLANSHIRPISMTLVRPYIVSSL